MASTSEGNSNVHVEVMCGITLSKLCLRIDRIVSHEHNLNLTSTQIPTQV